MSHNAVSQLSDCPSTIPAVGNFIPVRAAVSAGWAQFVGRSGCGDEVAVRTLFSTAGVHPRDRFDYWHEAACKYILDHDATPERRQDFHAELQCSTHADVGLLLFENSPMTVRHTARQASVSADDYLVCRQVSGLLTIRQDGRDVVLEPDHMTLIDPLRPYSGKFFVGSRLLVLRIPRRPLEARIGKTLEMTACSIKPSEPESKLASAFLGMLPAHCAEVSSTADKIIENQVLDLVAVSLAKTIERRSLRLSSSRSLVLMKVRAAIEARLTDPALDVATVAAIAGVSRRYANTVLADQGTSVMHFIQARRIERCRRALEDPLQSHRTVSEIAYGWGFSDMTHFGRKFRATYGVTPREYRKGAKVR
jgi:AraC family transcriptional regulator, positive regulator of tynA and feaB